MDIERTFTVAAARERVWQFITSPDEVAPCLPGCQRVEIVGPGKYKALIQVKVGPIKTSFNVDVDTVEERPPEYAAYSTRGEEGGKASRLSAESTLALRAVDEGHTEVTYTSKINVVGRLGKFAGGVMKKMAESMSDQFVDAFRKRVEPQPDGAGSETAAAPTEKGGVGARLSAFTRKVLHRDDPE